MKKILCVLLSVLILFSVVGWANPSDTKDVPEELPSTAINLLSDEYYRNGFLLCGRKVSYLDCGFTDYDGEIDQSSYSWRLCQWYTRLTLGNNGNDGEDFDINFEKDGKNYVYYNDAKKVEINPTDGVISLGVNAGFEYNYQERPSAPEWVHLLMTCASAYSKKYYLKDLKHVWAYIDFSIDYEKIYDVNASKFGKNAQVSQLVWYLQLHSGQYAYSKMRDRVEEVVSWFGIPLYDTRFNKASCIAGETFTSDPGTDLALYNIPADEYMTEYPKPDGKRHRYVVCLDDFAVYCFNNLIKTGWFPANSSFDDAYLNFSNVGWEVPGTIDCKATIYGIGVYVDEK